MDKKTLSKEVEQTEFAFQNQLNKEGAATAFYNFAAPEAVIKRENDSLIKGNTAIKNYYNKTFYEKAKAIWKPDFIDISEDGTMAYTYGKYTWTFSSKEGKEETYKGVFHTVWKKMPDKSWKYVWD